MYQCSPNELRDFSQGKLWKDLVSEMNLWKENIIQELSDPTFSSHEGKLTMARDERVLYDEFLRGCILALNRVMQLPENLAQMIEDDSAEFPNQDEENNE